MSIYENAAQDLIGQLSKLAGTTFTPDDFTFGPVEVYSGPDSPRNTRCRITITDPASQYQDWVWLYYDRLNLSLLANWDFIIPMMPAMPAPALYDRLSDIQQAVGILFTTDDVENTAIVTSDNPAQRQVTLTAKAGSQRFIGTVTLMMTIYQYPDMATTYPNATATGFDS